MVLAMAIRLRVSVSDKTELQAKLRCRSLPAEDVRRADIILRLAEGQGQRAVARQMRCSINTVRLWRERYQIEGLAGLYARHQGRQVEAESPALEANPRLHAPRSQRRLDPLEHAQAGRGTGNQSYTGGANLGQGGAQTPPVAPLHG